jgi:hypothetical protein
MIFLASFMVIKSDKFIKTVGFQKVAKKFDENWICHK